MTDDTETREPERPDVAYYWFVAGLAFVIGGIGGMTVMDSLTSAKSAHAGRLQSMDLGPPVPRAELDEVDTRPLDEAPEPESTASKRPILPEERIGSAESFISLFGEAPNPNIWLLENRNSRETAFWRNDFRAEMIKSSVNGLSLTIDAHPDGEDRPWEWAGSEMRTYERYGYGRYESFMRAAPGSGLISSLFTFTGKPFGDPKDEIDIEFNGARPRRVELNAWQNGKPFGAKKVPVPYDTSAEFHLYAFDWHPDSITWYIDGVEVHRVEASDHELPIHAGFLYANLWTGKMFSWHGRPEFENGASADYLCVSYLAPGDKGRTCADFYRAERPLSADWVREMN